jgi:hypothetical protein
MKVSGTERPGRSGITVHGYLQRRARRCCSQLVHRQGLSRRQFSAEQLKCYGRCRGDANFTVVAGGDRFLYRSNTNWNASGSDAMLFDATTTATRPFYLMKTAGGVLKFMVTDSGGNTITLSSSAQSFSIHLATRRGDLEHQSWFQPDRAQDIPEWRAGGGLSGNLGGRGDHGVVVGLYRR